MRGTRRIYLRHADKEYQNGYSDFYKHDPGITECGMLRIKKIGKELVEEWGKPSRIVSSPYRRARETAQILNHCLEEPFDEIYIDVNLSEYLGNHKHTPMDVTPETKVYSPPHPENFEDLNKRIQKHNLEARRRANELDNGVIWYVTHGLIIKQLAYMIGIKLNKQFPPLTCFSISEQENRVKGEVLLFNVEQNKRRAWEDPNRFRT